MSNPPPQIAHGIKSAYSKDVREQYNCISCGKNTDAFQSTDRYSKNLCRSCFGKRKDKRPRELNNLSGKEWAAFSRSVETYPDTRSEKQRDHGAAFPLALARQQIEIYTRTGETVLDPFVGVGTTLDAAEALGRNGIGIDINEQFIDAAKIDLAKATNQFRLYTGDARKILKKLKVNSVDFLFTSPPYSELLKNVSGAFAYKWKEHSTLSSIKNPTPYSDTIGDLGNMPYGDYLSAITRVMTQTGRVLKPGAYSVWVVKDYRSVKTGIPYVNLHGDVIKCAESAGFQLWDIRIFDQTKFRPLVCLGYPSKKFYLNIGHSFILVFRATDG